MFLIHQSTKIVLSSFILDTISSRFIQSPTKHPSKGWPTTPTKRPSIATVSTPSMNPPNALPDQTITTGK